MIGNSEDVLCTTHHPLLAYYTSYIDTDFNPHAETHEYAIEWEPNIVRWFIDGELVYFQAESYIQNLVYPMRIMMNLWASELENWVGPWNPDIMPVTSEYDFVKCYSYTPGQGNAGTGNNFTLLWEDHFDVLNEDLWTVELNGGFTGNYCTFKSNGVEVSNGKLSLKMQDPAEPLLAPVSISVDMSEQNLLETDVIYLNGTFNDWCGSCEPMTKNGDIWSTTVQLEPGRHEYLFTKNVWSEIGGAPLGSECDILPCDEWANYGVVLDESATPIVVDPVCWGSCQPCQTTGIGEFENYNQENLIRITDLLGRETELKSGEILLLHYSGGIIKKYYRYQ